MNIRDLKPNAKFVLEVHQCLWGKKTIIEEKAFECPNFFQIFPFILIFDIVLPVFPLVALVSWANSSSWIDATFTFSGNTLWSGKYFLGPSLYFLRVHFHQLIGKNFLMPVFSGITLSSNKYYGRRSDICFETWLNLYCCRCESRRKLILDVSLFKYQTSKMQQQYHRGGVKYFD